VHVVAALEKSLIVVAKTVLEGVEIDLDINYLAVARIVGVGVVVGVLARLDVLACGLDVLPKFRHVVV
jgi:hypothetical protein